MHNFMEFAGTELTDQMNESSAEAKRPSPPILLSIVIPAYNSQATIEDVIDEHLRVLQSLVDKIEDWEIICLDDGSTDETLQILDRLAMRVEKLRVLRHGINEGIYKSFADLFRAANGTHVYMTASDGQWPAANVSGMLDLIINSDSNLVIGVRRNRRQVYGLWRLIVSHAFNLLPRLLFGVKTADAGSVKLGNREIFQFELISRSPFAEAERIIKAQRSGYRVDFFPIEFLPRSGGRAKGARLRYVARSIWDCFACFWAYKLHRESSLKSS